VRVFLATPCDAAWSEQARQLLARVRPDSPPASWTRPDSWHVTLKFLGEISAETADRFALAIGEALGNLRAGSLSSSGALLLPGPGRPRVLGIGFAESSTALPSLSAVARGAELAFRRLGGEAENRAFRPHVTLGRVRQPWPREAVERFAREADAWSFPDWPVRSCILYESRLQSSGAVHTPLREWAFSPESAAVTS
jgi:2'-5' RNA ligase